MAHQETLDNTTLKLSYSQTAHIAEEQQLDKESGAMNIIDKMNSRDYTIHNI